MDQNGNVDTSITTNTNMTFSGGISVNSPNLVFTVNGVATFPDIAYSAEVNGLTLTAKAADTRPNQFEITGDYSNIGIPVIAIQNFDANELEWLCNTKLNFIGYRYRP